MPLRKGYRSGHLDCYIPTVVTTAPDAILVISVADLARRLKRSVESQTGRDWVEGEIASFKLAASGHVYFSLKDPREDACLECVMYRMDAATDGRTVSNAVEPHPLPQRRSCRLPTLHTTAAFMRA